MGEQAEVLSGEWFKRWVIRVDTGWSDETRNEVLREVAAAALEWAADLASWKRMDAHDRYVKDGSLLDLERANAMHNIENEFRAKAAELRAGK